MLTFFGRQEAMQHEGHSRGFTPLPLIVVAFGIALCCVPAGVLRGATLFSVTRTWQPNDECQLTLPMMDKSYPANAADVPVSPAKSDEPEVDLELAPYGCARLRLSEFPWIEPADGP
jgi:hypothetical protein